MVPQACWGFPGGSVIKTAPANTGDTGEASSIPGLGRSPGGGNGKPLQYPCLGNPMDRGAWGTTVHGLSRSQTRLSDWTHTLTCMPWGQVSCAFSGLHTFAQLFSLPGMLSHPQIHLSCTSILYKSARGTTAEFHRLGGVNNENVFPQSSGG